MRRLMIVLRKAVHPVLQVVVVGSITARTWSQCSAVCLIGTVIGLPSIVQSTWIMTLYEPSNQLHTSSHRGIDPRGNVHLLATVSTKHCEVIFSLIIGSKGPPWFPSIPKDPRSRNYCVILSFPPQPFSSVLRFSSPLEITL